MNKKLSIIFVILLSIFTCIYFFVIKKDFPECWKLESKMQEWYCIQESTIRYSSCRRVWWFLEKVCNVIPSEIIELSWENYYIDENYIVHNNTLYYRWINKENYIYNPSKLKYYPDWYLRDDKYLYKGKETVEIDSSTKAINNIFISWNELYLRKVFKRNGDQLDFYKIPNIDTKIFKILSHRVGYDEKYFVLFESYEKNPHYTSLQLLEWNFQNIEFTSLKWIFSHKNWFIVCYKWCVDFDKQSNEYTNIQKYILWNDSNSKDIHFDFNKNLISRYSDQLNFIINDWYISWEKDFDFNKWENSFEIIEIK